MDIFWGVALLWDADVKREMVYDVILIVHMMMIHAFHIPVVHPSTLCHANRYEPYAYE